MSIKQSIKNIIDKIKYFIHRKEIERKRKRYVILTIIGFALCIISAIATYIYNTGSSRTSPNQTEIINQESLITQEDVAFENPPENLNTLNILLLGYGGAGHSGGYLTDVIQVVHFDFEKSKIAFISIPRDLWIKLPGQSYNKINKAFTIGGAKTSAQMATIVTGLKVDNFISIDFVGFKRAIGYELEGIKVNVPETLDDPWYPISGKEQELCGKSPDEVASLASQYSGFQLEKQFECRYEHIHFDKGINNMEGGDALAYVRSRHGSAGGDFSRSQRQQALLLAVRDKLFELDVLKKIPIFFKQMIAHTDSNLDIDSIKKLSPLLAKSKNFEVVNITLSTANVFVSSKSSSGQYIVIPKSGIGNWSEVQNYIQAELKK